MRFVDEVFATGKSISRLSNSANRWRVALRTEASGPNGHFNGARLARLKNYDEMVLTELSKTTIPTGNLFTLNDLAYGEEHREFVQNRSKSDEDFLHCVELILGVRFTVNPPNWQRVKSASATGMREVSKFLNADEVVSRLGALRDNSGEQQQSYHAEQLLRLLDESQ